MKKILLHLVFTGFLLNSFFVFAGTTPAPTTTKSKSNTPRNAHHAVGGNGFTIEIRKGEIWAWGKNNQGQLGNGTFNDSNFPVQEASSSTNWVDINVGTNHVLALKADGTLWAWGQNNHGQLGNPLINANTNIPVQVGTDNDWVSIGCGSNQSYVIKADGTLWACGDNTSGALGLNSGSSSFNTLQQVGNNTNWRNVSGGNHHVAAIQSNGTLWTWGSNNNGQLGAGTLTINTTLFPTQIGNATNWISVESGDENVMALKNNGELYAWGLNNNGQLGNGNTNTVLSPTQIGVGINWIGMSSGQTGSPAVTHTLGVSADGKLYTWGANNYGQLGIGSADSNPHSTPIQVTSVSHCVNVESGYGCSFALGSNGTLFDWGYNQTGQLGNNSNTDVYSPASVSVQPTGWTSVSGGAAYATGLQSDGTLWVTGNNDFGQLGNGSSVANATGAVMVSGINFVRFATGQSHTIAIKSDGTLWSWGGNTNGQLGTGATADGNPHPTPTQIGTANNWVAVSAGDSYSMAIKSDGTLWAWGDNSFGQFGNGTVSSSPQTTPMQIGGLTTWVDVECGANFTLVIKSDGTLWGFGKNSSGQLGIGTVTSMEPSPTQVTGVSGNNWISVAVAGGGAHALGVTSNGNIYSWGANDHGQLGIGGTSPQSSPQQVTLPVSGLKGLTVYCGSFHSFVLASNGQVFAWGENTNGELGDGSFGGSHTTPELINYEFDVISMGCGFSHSCLIRADRNLICTTGLNSSGQLGNGSTSNNNIFQCVVQAAPCTAPDQPNVSASGMTFCGTGNATLNLTGNLHSAVQWTWYKDNCGGTFVGTGTSIVVNPTVTTTYFVRGEGGCIFSPGSCSSITITINAASPINISASPSSTICFGGSATLTATSSALYTYLWSDGATGANDLVSPPSTTNYNVTGTDENGCSSTASISITVNPLPVGSATNVAICSGSSANVSLGSTIGGTTFSWTSLVISGSASGDQSCSGCGASISDILTNTGNTASVVRYFVTPEANGCPGSVFTVDVTINPLPVIPSVTGPHNLCGLTNATYFAVSPGATGYSWSVPAGIAILTGQGTAVLVVSIAGPTINGNISVAAANGCGTSAATLYAVTKIAPVTPTISGPNAVCGLTTAIYTATSAGAATFAWTVPSGLTITSGQGTSSLQVTISSGTVNGNITVVAANGCGTSLSASMLITKKPGIPGSIAGSSLCGNTSATYSIAPVFSATSYNWTVPSGLTIVGPLHGTSITVSKASTFIVGNISVSAVNACGNVPGTTITVYGKQPVTPAPITGATAVCVSSSNVYSTSGSTGATAYVWTVTGNATVSGSGLSVTVNFSSGFTTGTLSVIATNPCGNSYTRTLSIHSVNCFSGFLAENSDLKSLTTKESEKMNFNIYPNPVSLTFIMEVAVDETNGSTQQLTMELYDMLGNKVLESLITNPKSLINMESFPNGIYLIRVIDSNANSVYSQRVIKE